ncbi:quinone oxidoreductase family protein [Rhodococcus sp. SJ-3]|uniref:quinone oxidoreductase family protein n=1 Tax=Rhodococcus sp. SJ-3 TaxID=3454628 RepID=UPI003F79E6AC
MRAVRLGSFGGPDVLVYETIDDPVPGVGEVLVRVAAAGVNFADVVIRSGAAPMALALPFIPGFEVAGTVEAVGPNVDSHRVGQRVVGSTVGGGYAEFVVLPAASALSIPAALSDDDAAAVLAQGSAAIGITAAAALRSGETALIHAAAGGVGSLLVQLAKHSGATVIGAVGGKHKMAVAEKIGADIVVDYSRSDWAEQVRAAVGGTVDVVLDTVGGRVTGQALSLVTPVTGRILLCGNSGGASSIDATQVMFGNATVTGYASATVPPPHRRSYADKALALASAGMLRPLIGSVRPLSTAAKAHQALENRETTGKTLLKPS